MDLFVEKTGSEKAGNINGAKIVKSTIDYANNKIEHYIEHQVRDADGDVVGVTGSYAVIELTPVEFNYWVTQQVLDATTARVNAFLNPS